MFRLLTTSLPALALCLGAANAASAAPLDAFWETPNSRPSPAVEPGILPGGCYLPGAGGTTTDPSVCPFGWCGTGDSPVPSHSPVFDCPNGFGDVAPWLGADPADPFARHRPGAVHRVPALPPSRRPVPEYPWPQSSLPAAVGMFEADDLAPPSKYLQDDLGHRRTRLRPGFDRPQRSVPGDFHILPVNDGTSNWPIRDTPFQPR